MLKLNKDNYHSLEANRQYMSCSLFKSFLPQYGGCEARSIAILAGEWEEKEKTALLVGQYVHAWNDGSLGKFIEKHRPEIYTRHNTLRADFVLADKMIETLKNDPLITKAREGEKEVILTGELFGMPWKCKIDIYNPALRTFTDIKTCREINRRYFNEQPAVADFMSITATTGKWRFMPRSSAKTGVRWIILNRISSQSVKRTRPTKC